MYLEAKEQYAKALKLGQKEHKARAAKGKYPYLRVLDEVLDESLVAGRVEVGLVDIPTEQIVGTKTAGRRTAFATNFMPLLPRDSEFGLKWIALCADHLGPKGIRDPIKCYEYLGRFYVQEGNKRVSVLKSYDALTIPGYVIRLLPMDTGEPEVNSYYEFLKFYRKCGLYQVVLPKAGDYAKLQAALGYEPDHIWTEDERKLYLARYSRFREAYESNGGKGGVTPQQAFLVWLRVYSLADAMEMSDQELAKSIEAVERDINLLEEDEPITVSTEPMTEDRGKFSRFFEDRPNHLNIAFVYTASSRESAWTKAHDRGRRYLEKVMGDRITVRTYETSQSGPETDETMEQAVRDGAEVIFATTPPLIGACRKIAANHPEVRVLNCSLSMPYTGVRTYYSRIYEGKFITGAIAGAMSRENCIGYVANYPIFGVPAGINAFALGARMTNPDAKIVLHWSCLPGSAPERFAKRDISVVSNREAVAGSVAHRAWDWGTYQFCSDGTMLPLASPCWDWGRFYEKVVLTIFAGGWDPQKAKSEERAVNYWWGMDSGVIDVQLSDQLPDGVRQLATILKDGLTKGTIDPFYRVIRSQDGTIRNDGTRHFLPEEIMNMDWLCDNVEGWIPTFDELLPMSRNMVRLLGIYRDQLPPEKEGVIL